MAVGTWSGTAYGGSIVGPDLFQAANVLPPSLSLRGCATADTISFAMAASKVPRLVHRLLVLIPPLLLLIIVATALLHLPLNLAGLEPFDAFVFWIAGSATLAIAVVGLAASALVPMAYCRYGCPTGSVLDYLRLHGHSDRLSRRDGFAAALLVLALVL